MMYFLSLLMLIALASAQPPSRTDAAWAFNGLCLRGAGIPAYDALMHAAVATFMRIDPSTGNGKPLSHHQPDEITE